MSAARSRWVRSLTSALLASMLAVGVPGDGARAQGPGRAISAAGGTPPPVVPTLAGMAQAVRTNDYTAVQLRRFRDAQGNVVTVRERVAVDANGTAHPDFVVTFLGVEGELPGSLLTLEWQRTYDRFGPLFFSHGTFRVRDLAAASANYTLHDFGGVVRANRSARRMVVFPGTLDKAIWVVDFDVQTQVPLYFAEFDVQMHLLAEVEAQTFVTSCGPLPLTAASTGITPLPDFSTARAFMGNPPQMVDPIVNVANDYQVDSVEVHVDPLNGRQKLVMTYTDGVDQFLLVQAPGTPDLFGGLPSKLGGGNVVARFRDPAMSVLLFWESGVSFHVAGRGSLTRLDDLARALYVQALSTN